MKSIQTVDVEIKQTLGLRVVGENLLGDEELASLEAMFASQFQSLLEAGVRQMREADDEVAVIVTDLQSTAKMTEVSA